MDPQTTGHLHYLRDELPLEPVSCGLCGGRQYSVISAEPPFTVARCEDCEFVYVTPRVPESHLHLIYAWDYYESEDANDYGYECYLEEGPLHERTFAMKADIVQKHKSGGRVLEVGCAGGYFLQEMQRRGFEVHGIEVSEKAAQHARENLGLPNIHCGRMEDVSLEGRFDVIALWDVIEHVSDPLATLHALRHLIAEEGILVIQTQNIDSFFARLMGRRWQHFKHLEHIYHFSPETMANALAEAQFEVRALTGRGAGKYISGKFVRERTRRFSRFLHYCLKPLGVVDKMSMYVNLHDEFIVVAGPSTGAGKEDG